MNEPRLDKVSELIKKLINGDFQAKEIPGGLNDNIDDIIINLNTLAEELSENYYSRIEIENGIGKLEKVVIALASLNFSKKALFGDKISIFDGISAGLNMLGEELEHSTVSVDYLENIYKSMSDMLIVTDEQYIIKTVNQATLELLKYSENELIGKHIEVLFKDNKFRNKENIFIDIANKEPVINKENVFVTKDNNRITILFSANTMYNNTGAVIGIVFLAQDIGFIKKAQQNLIDAKKMAEEANLAKSKFLSSMSHELRTPLNSILGYNQVLKKGKNITKEQKDQIDTVLSSGLHLLDLINDILDISKIETGKQVLIPTNFNLPHMLNIVFNITKIGAKEKGLYFHYNINAQIPEVVHNDKRKVEQILLNILSNAVKFTNNGGIDFSVATKKAKENIIIFKIEDTGVGIPKENLKAIFEPFNQLEKIYNAGTGLGLAITKSLVELMKGTLSISSSAGKGSCFTIELPFEIISHTTRKKLRKTIQLPGKKQQKEKKIPTVDILDKILIETEKGDYNKLKKIVNELRKIDKDFEIFCDKLNSLVKKYDENAIVEYISILKTNNSHN